MKVAIVGATGLVGGVMLKVLEERNFPVTELLPVASEKSIGKEIIFEINRIPSYPYKKRFLKNRPLQFFQQAQAYQPHMHRFLQRQEVL